MSYTMKFPALVLAVAMGFNSGGFAQQAIEPESSQIQALDEMAAKAKAEVTRRGIGAKSKVRVKMRDKHKLTGKIVQIDEHSFQLQVEPTILDDPEPAKGTVLRIPYSEVEKIRGARSRPANAGIGVGVIVAAVAILAAIAFLRYDKCSRGNCGP
jgi:hypothetical protein